MSLVNPSLGRSYQLKIDKPLLDSFKTSKKIKLANSILCYKTNYIDHSRLGIQISKKAVKLSVVRNLVRRIIREDFRQNIAEFNKIDLLILITHKISSKNMKISDILIEEWKQSKSLLKNSL